MILASVCALAGLPGAALAGPVKDPVPIAPGQPFAGLVNGASSGAVIEMACFGPVHPGQTGHPLADQSVEVQRSPKGPGSTGKARQIVAELSVREGASVPLELGRFSSYYVAIPIPTTLRLPCDGSGTLTFAPVGGGSKARDSIAQVVFAGQP